jgi:hypothetical protein
MLKKLLIITVVMVLGGSLLFAENITGRDIVKTGAFTTKSGTLKYEAPEWHLVTKDGSYQLHFGNRNHLTSTGMELEDGKYCKIEGIATGKDIAVVSATIKGKTYTFRDENGIPEWAGKGNRRGKRGFANRTGAKNGFNKGNRQFNCQGRG